MAGAVVDPLHLSIQRSDTKQKEERESKSGKKSEPESLQWGTHKFIKSHKNAFVLRASWWYYFWYLKLFKAIKNVQERKHL